MRQVRLGLMEPHSMLDDLVQISPRPLPDQEQFLADWIAFLRTQSGSAADAWLREAVRLSQGTPGLETLARTEGQTHPRAYLDWFSALEKEDRHPEVLAAAQEALRVLPAKRPIRAAIADHLCAAAARMNDEETLRIGRWEAFLVNPTLSRLLDLRDVFPAGKEQTTLMHRAIQHIQDYRAQPPRRPTEIGWEMDGFERAVWVDDSVLAHACLLAQEFDAARQIAAGKQVLGWSSSRSAQGLVVAFFLVLLSGRAPGTLPSNLAQVWQWRLEYSTNPWYGAEKDPVRMRLERAYADLFTTASLSGDRQKSVLSWCLDVAKRRVDAIVGDQHRGSYDKAAVLTVACAETLRLRGDDGAAGLLVEEIRNRFPRHRNFQAELRAALQGTKR
jgi:hypothetical protein